MDKNRGSILIEAVISLAILSITTVIVLYSSIGVLKSIEKRKSIINMKETMTAICNELKFNNKYNEIYMKLKNGEVKYRYSEDYLSELTIKEILEMDKANEGESNISLKIVNEIDRSMNLNVKISHKGEYIEEMILKAEWMDEI